MTAEPQKRWTVAEYLAHERQAETKSEYYRGELFAMAGASREHNLLVAALTAALYPQLDRTGCELYASDMRVRVAATDLYTYPDLAIVCGDPRFEDDSFDILLNPTVLIEVLSPSTEDYDRGRKSAHYRAIPSLAAYLLVAQDRVYVETLTRRPDGSWLLAEATDRETRVELPAIGCTLTIADLYARMPAGWPA